MTKKINEKISELNEKVEWFYGDEFKLDEASAKYKEATKLAKEIEEDLKNLKNEIKIIEEDFSKE
jgi:exodeoxyribonuclease VII small subunit